MSSWRPTGHLEPGTLKLERNFGGLIHWLGGDYESNGLQSYCSCLCPDAWFSSPRVSQAQKLVVGYSGITAIQAPFWIINDAGFFKQEGLEANLVYIAASSTMAQAMMAGDLRPTVKRS